MITDKQLEDIALAVDEIRAKLLNQTLTSGELVYWLGSALAMIESIRELKSDNLQLQIEVDRLKARLADSEARKTTSTPSDRCWDCGRPLPCVHY